jgi:hypothetical protein
MLASASHYLQHAELVGLSCAIIRVRIGHGQHLVKPGFKRGRSDQSAFRVVDHPFRVARCRVMIPLDGDVDWHPDSPTVATIFVLRKFNDGGERKKSASVFAHGSSGRVSFRSSMIPLQRAVVSFAIPVDMLNFTNRENQRMVEAGEFEIMVGASSN